MEINSTILFALYLKLTIKTDTIICTIKNSYAANLCSCLTIDLVNKRKND